MLGGILNKFDPDDDDLRVKFVVLLEVAGELLVLVGELLADGPVLSNLDFVLV